MNKRQLRILLAPLDWGLGHLTRCIPLIHFLSEQGHVVFFAGNKDQQAYVNASVKSSISYLDLFGYEVRYGQTKIGLLPKIMLQIPRIRKRIKQEHLWLQTQIVAHRIDAVISDNRYGLFSDKVPCVLMTHQLQILSGFGGIADRILLKLHYRFIQKFAQCWVADVAEEGGLSGALAHPEPLPQIKTQYIGLLSQCWGQRQEPRPSDEEELVLILLSGTEPQRSILADILWRKAIKSDKHIVFVAGSEQALVPALIPEHISYHKRLSSSELLIAIQAASMVICRSGYSSLMDLIALDKRAILIPTPGQTEQEYLAKLMQQKRLFMAAGQTKFDIQTSLLNAAVFPFAKRDKSLSFTTYQKVMKEWLATI